MKQAMFSISVILMLVYSVTVYSANAGTGPVSLTKLTNWNSGGSEKLLIYTDQNIKTNLAGCIYEEFYELEETASNISRSMILAAFVSKSKNIFYDLWGWLRS